MWIPLLSGDMDYIQNFNMSALDILQCRIQPNYRTVRLDFSKLLNKLVVNYQPNKGTP